MSLSNLDKSSSALDVDANSYIIDPDLLDIIKGFFESKGFDSNTSVILSRNMIVSAIDSGNVSREDLLSILQKGGELYDVMTVKIQKPGTGYQSGDRLRFKYPGVLEEILLEVSAVDSAGGIISVTVETSGLIETKPRNPMSANGNTGTGRGAFFNFIYRNTLKPNAELSRLASYLINTTRYPTSYTGVLEDLEDNKVYKRLIV